MNLLVTGAFSCTTEQLKILEDMGNSVLFLQNEKDALPCAFDWIEGVICNGLFLHHSIEQFTSLKYIQLTSAGYDRVPMDYAKDHGIKVFNARGVYSLPMAEFALAGVLSLMKQMRFFSENQKQHKWEKHRRLSELCGKSICIVGCGSVGCECAVRFSAMGCRVLGIDTAICENSAFEKIYPLDELEDVLRGADVVILTLPLTDETRHLFDRARFNAMKTGAIFVNISRGGVVDTEALINALTSDQLGGAILDVFETEPLEETSPLWDMENVMIIPHNSFVGERNKIRLLEVILKNLKENTNRC